MRGILKSFGLLAALSVWQFSSGAQSTQLTPGLSTNPPANMDTTSDRARCQAFVDSARTHAIRLATVEAGHGFDDMQRLDPVVGDARIVALGEATHGTREFFQLKHRLIEFLANRKGFTIFSIEANMPEAYRLNEYVLQGTGDPKQLLKGMYFWTWNTQEVLELIEWMRQFNQSGKGHIEFTGFDMQFPTVPLDIVRKFVAARDGSYFTTLEPLYQQISRMTKRNEEGSGIINANFPIADARGKRIQYSGYIKTEDITQGYAGLWWRVDGEKGSQPLAFDNMHDRGAKGTTPWTRYEITLDVPANARNTNFGMLHQGNGTAWFDSLQVEVNGVPYVNNSVFDFDFESATLQGFSVAGGGKEMVLDNSVSHSGKQSLRSRMESVGDLPAKYQRLSDELVAQKCRDVVNHLDSNRPIFLRSGATAESIDWAIQNARLVLQYVQMRAGNQTRDASMAENIKWITDHNPGAKLVLWAHNGHVTRSTNSGYQPMGSYLSKWFGKAYVNFGFAFGEGSFRAVERGKGLHEFTVEPAPEGSLDRALADTGIPILALDLRQLPRRGAVADWMDEPHLTRSIGAVYSAESDNSYLVNTMVQDSYDVLLFVNKTTAAKGN